MFGHVTHRGLMLNDGLLVVRAASWRDDIDGHRPTTAVLKVVDKAITMGNLRLLSRPTSKRLQRDRATHTA